MIHAIDSAIRGVAPFDQDINFPIIHPNTDPNKSMRAAEWMGKDTIQVVNRQKPLVTEPADAVIRITSATLCGSDLHLYHHQYSGMDKHDIIGHESMGIVERVGPDVKDIKAGDRVIVSPVIADGTCDYCKRGQFDACDTTNPSKLMEAAIGHRCAGLLGYGHLTGGYDGIFAEYVRVPYADVNLLKVPDHLHDEKVFSLADSLTTAWHANELAEVEEGKTVVIWGCGPVGLYTAMWAKFRKAGRIISIDCVPYRLDMAKKLGCETVNFEEVDVVKTIQQMVPGGPDICIEAVGFRFPKSILHKIERAVRLETDAPDIITECITLVRKGGNVAIIGDYYGLTNHFPIGALFEKGITLRAGIVPVQKYWRQLLEYIDQGKVDPSCIVTHHMPLESIAEAYKMFDEKEKGAIKIIINPQPANA
jgi:threonine dehydrogenase-like Zn-dependent dehydrogenase